MVALPVPVRWHWLKSKNPQIRSGGFFRVFFVRFLRPRPPAAGCGRYGLARRGQVADAHAWLDIFLPEPAQVHFQRIAHGHGSGRAVAVERMRLHVFDVDDLAAGIDKGHGQGQRRVFHPHALRGRGAKDEQHACIRRHLFTVHQALFALLFRSGHFRLDQVHAGRELQALALRCLRLRNAGTRQQGDGQAETAKGSFHGAGRWLRSGD